MRFQKMMLLAAMVLCLSGCAEKRENGGPVVCEVDVTCRRGKQMQQFQYTQPGKMEMVLDYLRLQPDLGPVDADPERYAGEQIRIDVILSDGTARVYYQQAGQFMSRQLHPWQRIDPQRAEAFSQKLRKTATDL